LKREKKASSRVSKVGERLLKPDLYVVTRFLDALWWSNTGMKKTHLQMSARLNYQNFLKYLQWLESHELVKVIKDGNGNETVTLSEKGMEAHRMDQRNDERLENMMKLHWSPGGIGISFVPLDGALLPLEIWREAAIKIVSPLQRHCANSSSWLQESGDYLYICCFQNSFLSNSSNPKTVVMMK
jgi:predicted transcriptional regulator